LIDIVRILDEYGIDHTPIVRGWVNTRCPYCGDRSNHGGFTVSGSVFNCWKCGRHNIEYTLRRILDVSSDSLQDIIERYQTRSSLLNTQNRRKASKESIKLPGGRLEKVHQRYLFNRGFDPFYLEKKYKLQGTGPVGDWKFRIIIPIFYKGNLVSFQGRSILDNNSISRYKTLEVEDSVISAKDVLFNIDSCISNKIVITEGPFDAMRLGDGVACTLGTEMTTQQIELIAYRFSKAIFLFDPETKAQHRAEKQGSDLAALGLEVDIADLELDHDPGDLTEDEVIYVRKELKLS